MGLRPGAILISQTSKMTQFNWVMTRYKLAYTAQCYVATDITIEIPIIPNQTAREFNGFSCFKHH